MVVDLHGGGQLFLEVRNVVGKGVHHLVDNQAVPHLPERGRFVIIICVYYVRNGRYTADKV